MDENKQWLSERTGYISASRLSDLMTKGRSKDKAWGESAISYLEQLSYERAFGKLYAQNANPLSAPYTGYHTDSAALRFGRENEPYAVEWIRQNLNSKVRYYETDFERKPFCTVPWAKYGATPDCDAPDANGNPKAIYEIKCTFSDGAVYKYFCPNRSTERKIEDVKKEHLDQILGQFLACPTVEVIFLVKYNPPRDEYDWDLMDVTDPQRGCWFIFERAAYQKELEEMKERIIFADMHLNSGEDIELINQRWNEFKNA